MRPGTLAGFVGGLIVGGMVAAGGAEDRRPCDLGFGPGTAARAEGMREIGRASESVRVLAGEPPAPDVMLALLAARKRGVEVRIVASPDALERSRAFDVARDDGIGVSVARGPVDGLVIVVDGRAAIVTRRDGVSNLDVEKHSTHVCRDASAVAQADAEVSRNVR